MLSRNVDVYYVLNQRKKYTFAMFSEHMKFYHAMQLCKCTTVLLCATLIVLTTVSFYSAK